MRDRQTVGRSDGGMESVRAMACCGLSPAFLPSFPHSRLLTGPPPVLAMDFGNPTMLWGLLLAAVPMVLHLLFRPNQQIEPWGAMPFLQAAVRRRRNRLRLESLFHLLVRSALLAVIPLALARPHLSAEGEGSEPGRPVHRVLVVDTSMSMGAEGEGGDPFEWARRTWREIVDKSRPGDSFQLVQTRAHGPRTIISTPSFDPQSVRVELDSLVRTYERGVLDSALRDAQALLNSSPAGSKREVVLLTDMQRPDWVSENGDPLRGLRSVLKDLASRSELVILDGGLASSANATVVDIRGLQDWHFVGQPSRFEIKVRRQGKGAKQVDLDFLVDGVPHSRRQIELPDGRLENVTAELTFSTPGEHIVTARIGDDDLADDNQRQLVVHVARNIHVLLVGKDSQGPSATGHDYVQIALDPPWQGDGGAPRSRFEVQVVGETELRQLDPADFDCILLRNVAFISLQEAERLGRYVRNGGGLILAPGEDVETDPFNSLLHDAEGLAPARLVEAVGGATQLETPFTFESNVPDHPVVSPFQQFPGSGFATTRIYRYFKTSDMADDATVVVKLSNGDPLLIDRAVGRGRVLMLTTALSDEWGSWVVWPSFLPMLHESIQYASSGRVRRRAIEVGESIEWDSDDGAEIAIECPDGRLAHPHVASESQQGSLVFNETALPGIYRMAGTSGGKLESFAVNVPADEGDLDHVSPADLTKSTLSGMNFRTQLDGIDGGRAAVGVNFSRGDLSTRLLIVALLLLLVDLFSSWSLAAGTSLLAAGVFVGLLKALLPIEWMPAAVMAGGLALILMIATRAAVRE